MRLHNGHVLGIAGLLSPLMGVVAPLGLPIVLFGGAVAAIVLRRLRHREWPSPPSALVILVGVAVAWSALSLVWSIDLGAGITKLPLLALLLAAGLALVDAAIRLSDEERAAFVGLCVWGIGIGLALLLFEFLADAPVRRLTSTDTADWNLMLDTFNRSVSAVVLFIWPAVLVVSRRNRTWGAAVCVLALMIVWPFSSSAAIAALMVGIAAYALARLFPHYVVRGLGAVMVLGVLASPLLLWIAPSPARVQEQVPGLSYSGHHRLVIWQFTNERIGERPLLGWGFNSSRSIPGRESRPEDRFTALPLHPHNAVLQWWLELGVVGALLGAGLIGWLFAAIDRMREDVGASSASLGLALTAITLCSLGFGIWQSWWLAALWLSAAMMVAANRPPRSAPGG